MTIHFKFKRILRLLHNPLQESLGKFNPGGKLNHYNKYYLLR